jgi:dihydrofolate synthase / folylpolyglutamate synthase
VSGPPLSNGAGGADDRTMSSEIADAVAWLDAHTNFELGMPARTAVPTLERIRALCDLLGDPQQACPAIHLTGTNGKGSTARILTELLAVNGLSVGTYTSPNLWRVNERITRNGIPIDDHELAETLNSLAELETLLPDGATRFELLTAAALRWFADVAVDVMVVEVGLGGRWDATNVVDADVAVVTNVSYDHVDILGPTLRDIAKEKAGIIKPGCRLILGVDQPDLVSEFTSVADDVGALQTWERGIEFDCDANVVAVGGRFLDLRTPGASYSDVFLSLHGAHQGDNAAAAVAAAEAFFDRPLDTAVVEHALGSVTVPGRLEVVGHEPLVVLDGAHNVAGARALATALRGEFPVPGTVVAVAGMLHGRDPAAVLGELGRGRVSTVVAYQAPTGRAMTADEVASGARAAGLGAVTADSVGDALSMARPLAGDDGMVVVCGSLYVVAEARAVLASGFDGHGARH